MIDSPVADYKSSESLIGANGPFKMLTMRRMERALNVEITKHRGPANDAGANPAGGTCNGKSKKMLKAT